MVTKKPPSCALRIGETAFNVGSTDTVQTRKTGYCEATRHHSSGPIPPDRRRRRHLRRPYLTNLSIPPSPEGLGWSGPRGPEMPSTTADSGGRTEQMSSHRAAVRTAEFKQNAATGPTVPILAEGTFSNPQVLLKRGHTHTHGGGGMRASKLIAPLGSTNDDHWRSGIRSSTSSLSSGRDSRGRDDFPWSGLF